MTTMRRTRISLSVLALASAALAGAAVAQSMNIAIATGGTGGVYYPMGGGMANVLSKYVPGVQATARVTGGSVDNLRLIHSGQSEVALVMVDAARDAYEGVDKFKGNKVAVRTLMVLYPNRMHVVSVEGTGVTSMAGLKGKRVSTGSPGSATEVMAFRVIEAQGCIATRTCGASASAWRSPSTLSRTAGSTRSSGSAGCRPRRSPISAPRRA
jgi:TRAP transporter TAXI family solute receptor